jgi:4-aminobutyrate aminotransferase-like enzyme
MAMSNAFTHDGPSQLSGAERDLMGRRERVLGPAYRLFYEHPVHFVRGEGVWLFDPDNNAYLDAYNNVASTGHSHPRVVKALAGQAAMLNTHTRYLSESVVEYAERLTALFPAPLTQAMFTCTGSEANDLALRIARAHTGGVGVIVTKNAYHGVTQAVAELSPSLGPLVAPGSHVRTVPAPDSYRGNADIGAAFAAAVRAAMGDLRRAGFRVAALLVDTVFSSDGVFTHPEGFLQQAVAEIRKAGGLFIADEVQAGFGRTGRTMWGFQRHGVVPDIVTLGKPMGAGHPMAGVVAGPELIAVFGKRSRYFNTFGGNPVSCAVGMAVLDVIEDEDLMTNAAETGEHLKRGLRAIASRCERIGDVRGAGLFIGVELVRDAETRAPAPELASQLVNTLRERRILISTTGLHGNVLKIRPPLVFSKKHADVLLEAIDGVLTDTEITRC